MKEPLPWTNLDTGEYVKPVARFINLCYGIHSATMYNDKRGDLNGAKA